MKSLRPKHPRADSGDFAQMPILVDGSQQLDALLHQGLDDQFVEETRAIWGTGRHSSMLPGISWQASSSPFIEGEAPTLLDEHEILGALTFFPVADYPEPVIVLLSLRVRKRTFGAA